MSKRAATRSSNLQLSPLTVIVKLRPGAAACRRSWLSLHVVLSGMFHRLTSLCRQVAPSHHPPVSTDDTANTIHVRPDTLQPSKIMASFSP
ncbi:hypothetical protein BaRGS_00039893 [Batillaria attramentaria]|uniref:Uncharacterized protein n=1 Tax=Batillaria attramentaria TaxID=370345 RepID=A0ABD0J217_9CAEN